MPTASARISFFAPHDGNTLWSYDTPAIITEKMICVKAQSLGQHVRLGIQR